MDIFDKLYYYQKEPMEKIIKHAETANEGGIVFFGDSIIECYDLQKYFPDKHVYNCGVSGATTAQLLYFHEYAIKPYKPKEVVILVGTNDFGDDHQFQLLDIVYNMYKLLEIMNNNYELDKITLISPLPIDENVHKQKIKTNTLLRVLGKEYSKLTTEFNNVQYIDVFDSFLENGNLIASMTEDGLHLNEQGYEHLTKLLKRSLP